MMKLFAKYSLNFLLVSLLLLSFNSSSFGEDLLGKLPKSELSSSIASIATEWGDSNISTGRTDLGGGVFKKDIPKTAAAWRLIALALFEKKLDEITDVDKEVKGGATITLYSQKFSSKKHIVDAVKALMLGNAYDVSNPDNSSAFKSDINNLIMALGTADQIQTLKAETKLYNSSEESSKKVIYFAFFNKETKNVVTIFVIEGSM